MGTVQKSIYRQPPTAEGLRKIEHGELDYFDPTAFSNANTGVLEQYFNERTMTTGFGRSNFDWHKVAVGICLGSLFTIINQYTGLKVGIIVGGTWYVSYLFGLWRRWKPCDINIASGAGTGTERTNTGFVFTFPAIYLLAKSVNYVQADGTYFIEDTPSVAIPIIAAMLGGMLGVMYFTLFRRIWLVEDPLPCPGHEASVKLADIANDLSQGAAEQAAKAMKLVATWAAASAIFTFLRSFPTVTVDGSKTGLLDKVFENTDYYRNGTIIYPNHSWSVIGFGLIPIQLAIGWFMKFRSALLVSIGTILSWLIIVPMAIHFDTPVYVQSLDADVSLSEFGRMAAYASFGGIAQIIAIGAILGGGLTSLAKMAPTFRKAGAGMFSATPTDQQETDADAMPAAQGAGSVVYPVNGYIPGKGWFEWPMSFIPFQMAVVLVGVSLVFILGDYPVLPSVVFAILLVTLTFALGAIAVKVMGEIAVTPVSGTSFIVFMMLFAIFKLLGTSETNTLLMALLGTTVFGTSISLSADITYDFKIGTYLGTRPFHLVKGELTGIVPGVIIAALAAVMFSTLLAEGKLELDAPQANAFARFALLLAGGNVPVKFFIFGVLIGIWAEFSTGMGTSFGLGMYLRLPITLPLLLGGAARSIWNDFYLNPTAEAEEWSETKKTMVSLETYMRGTGLILGEALMGTMVAFYFLIF